MADKSRDGWAWFDGAPQPAQNTELSHCFMRTFQSHAGRQVLDYLRASTIGRRVRPDAPDSVLRHLEGQRYLFQLIERLADAGPKEPARDE